MLEHKLGKANLVADASSRKTELAARIQIQGELLTLIKEGTEHDPLAKQLVSLVQHRKWKRVWVENDLYTPKDSLSMFRSGETCGGT